jgi:uncharacterized repeat protein (TIGR01451 family)
MYTKGLEEDKMLRTKRKNQTTLFWLIIGLVIVGVLFGLIQNPKTAEAAAGDFTITHKAARPSNYIPPIPYPGLVSTPAIGRADGSALIPGADFATGVTSLNPSDMALGQIVPFEYEIVVGAGAVAADLPICFVYKWGTTSSSAFGYDESQGILTAFVDTSEITTDTGNDATVTSLIWDYNTTNTDYITATVCVGGLDPGDQVVVEVWPVLDCEIVPKMGSNVDSRMETAYTDEGATINTGANSIRLNQVGGFESVSVDLSVTKSDGDYSGISGYTEFPPYPYPGGTFVYQIEVTNLDAIMVANGVFVTDTLDPNLKVVSGASSTGFNGADYLIDPPPPIDDPCSYSGGDINGFGGTFVCELCGIAAGETTTITFMVEIDTDAPTTGLIETGVCVDGDESDLCNTVEVTATSDDPILTNNTDSEPKDIGIPTAVTLLYFTSENLGDSIQLNWETASEVNNLGFYLYRSTTPVKPEQPLTELIPSLSPGGMEGAIYAYVDDTAEFGLQYYYWLEDIDTNERVVSVNGPVIERIGWFYFIPILSND